MAKSSGTAGRYQRCMPITSTNLGKNLLKTGTGSGPDKGKRAAERRLRQLAKAAAKAHASDCAIHNAPAYEPGACDCHLSRTEDSSNG